MSTLFEIETDLFILRCAGPVVKNHLPPRSTRGTLRIFPQRKDSEPKVKVFDTKEMRARPLQETDGPPLFEETLYRISIYPKTSVNITLLSRDPVLVGSSDPGPNGELFLNVNFRGQVGFSLFRVKAEGMPELSFEVEVFPAKIDYKSDYEAMLAEITDFFMGLAMEYLRSTYRPAGLAKTPEPSQIEWLTILRQIMDDLSAALHRIAFQPNRALTRTAQFNRPERIRRVDSRVRRAVMRGQGTGRMQPAPKVGMVRAYIMENRPVETLDTPEHRWIRSQLADIQYRLTSLKKAELQRQAGSRFQIGARGQAVISKLDDFQSRIHQLMNLAPFSEALGDPPASFSSLVLQAAPGYREAYIACLILRLGLKIEGGPFELTLKDISALYEYWCYLGVLRLAAEKLDINLKPENFLTLRTEGLAVDLKKTRSKPVLLQGSGPQSIAVTYNPAFDSPTGRHQPDVGLAININGWRNSFGIILDAKYRIDSSRYYVQRHNAPGPPEDAVNVLHRYRDAILASSPSRDFPGDPPQRLVIMGAALFPFDDGEGNYKNHTFYKSLDQVGIGALPFLPGQMTHVRAWLEKILSMSGWSLADLAPEHRTSLEQQGWKRDASTPVLIAVLRPNVDHLDWVKRTRQYYAPLARLGKRRFSAQSIAFYQGRRGQAGAITHIADVKAIDVVPRSKIKTPWESHRSRDDLQIVYSLSNIRQLPTEIPVPHMRSFRWASKLSLRRAQTGRELFMETAPEWQLYEELKARRMQFHMTPGAPGIVDPDDPRGRALFRIGGWTIRYAGADGFRISSGESMLTVSSLREALGIVNDESP